LGELLRTSPLSIFSDRFSKYPFLIGLGFVGNLTHAYLFFQCSFNREIQWVIGSAGFLWERWFDDDSGQFAAVGIFPAR